MRFISSATAELLFSPFLTTPFIRFSCSITFPAFNCGDLNSLYSPPCAWFDVAYTSARLGADAYARW
jgi:hypothetical protein